ncbi:hypothetical protein ACWDA3_56445 [Nonomuraea rubra]
MTDARMPRWVKVAGIITAVVVLLFVVLMLVGDHGPGRHSGAASGNSPAVTTLRTA